MGVSGISQLRLVRNPGSQVLIVSSAFDSLSPVQRQRLVHKALKADP